MLTGILLAVSSIIAADDGNEARQVVLENEHLIVRFKRSAAGPRLESVLHRASGETFRFQSAEEIVLAVVPPETIHDAKTQVRYRLQDGFRFAGLTVNEKQNAVTLRFAGELVDTAITYRLQADAAVLRKETVCTARERGAYVTGVTHWMVKPANLPLTWPKSGSFGQPAIVVADGSGYFVTLEWPRAKVTSIDGDIRIAYRPGLALAAGESRQVAAGSIGCFKTTGPSREEKLEAARRAFFDHVAERVRPTFPFPVKFTTWGPWLGQMREDRILEVLDDLAYVGTDLLHLDAGWQHPDYPYSQRLPKVRDADDQAWDRAMIQPERLPGGLLPIAKAANKRGMKISLWFDACGNVFVREDERWAIRNREGQPIYSGMWERRWPQLPRQSLAAAYGERLEEFVLQMIDRYDLGGIMFDNNHYTPDFAADRRSLASGGNTLDVQLGTILRILDEGERRRPGIYRFYCRATSWPWALLYATHIHAGDPGMSKTMRLAIATDHPARALAYERRLAWQRHYDNFVPPWGVKGDIAGWSVQQRSAIPINLKHTGLLVPTGEGWTQNMFTCFATTAARDIRFSFRQMPSFDRDILKEWLAWDRQRSRFVLNCRPILKDGRDPNQGLAGYSHVRNGQGVIYLFNNSFEGAAAELTLDEHLGLGPQDRDLSAHLVYPVKAPLGSGKLSHGQTVRVPIIGKDCVVIEMGLDPPEKLTSYADYERAAASVRRSYTTMFLSAATDLFTAVKDGPVRLEVGNSPRDRRLAAQILETLGAASGRRLAIDRCCAVPAAGARCRLIVGSHESLAEHHDVGEKFCETLYNRYIRWDDRLFSAPLCVALPGDELPTFCLIAPRSEQLARLANDLTSEFVKQTEERNTADIPLTKPEPVFSFETEDLPHGQPVLRFRPVVRQHGHLTLPGDLEMIRFRIEAEHDGKRSVLWQENIPPFASPGHGPDPASFDGTQWWQDRVISVADFAGRNTTFHFTAQHIDGRGHPQLTIGFTRVAILASSP